MVALFSKMIYHLDWIDDIRTKLPLAFSKISITEQNKFKWPCILFYKDCEIKYYWWHFSNIIRWKNNLMLLFVNRIVFKSWSPENWIRFVTKIVKSMYRIWIHIFTFMDFVSKTAVQISNIWIFFHVIIKSSLPECRSMVREHHKCMIPYKSYNI